MENNIAEALASINQLSNEIKEAQLRLLDNKLKLELTKALLFEKSKEETKLSDARTENVVTSNETVIGLLSSFNNQKTLVDSLLREYEIELAVLKYVTK